MISQSFLLVINGDKYVQWSDTIQVGEDLDYIVKDEYVENVPDNVIRNIIPAYINPRLSKFYNKEMETEYVVRLDEYKIPENLQNDIDHHNYFKSLNPWFCEKNYKTLMHNLLWIEEAEAKKTN